MTERLPKFSLGAMQIKRIRVDVLEHMYRDGHVEVRCTMYVPSVATGEVIDVTQSECIDRRFLSAVKDPDYLKRVVRGTIIRALEHEVDEWLSVDGERITDPHANDFKEP